MRAFLLTAALATAGSAAFAQGELTCWYDVNGVYSGADSGNWGEAPIGQASPNTRGYGGGAWVFILGNGTWSNGNNCPRSIDISGGAVATTPTTPTAPVPAVATADWSLAPGYGTATLNEGFLPDPYVVNLEAGGPVEIASQVGGCGGGWVAEAPDFRLTYNAGNFAALTFEAASAEDITLVINGPDGQWTCVDDVHGTNPAVIFSPPVAAGQYDIWVGTFAPDIIPAATLFITEADTPQLPTANTGTVTPTTPSGGGTADWALDPGYGTANLNAGFLPDPHTVNLQAGGYVDIAQQVPGCSAGYVAEAPDYRLNYTAGGASLTFTATSAADTTLVISDPNGQWFCVDDYNGLDPLVFFGAPQTGQYDIWVGTWDSNILPSATLSITEY